MLRALIAVALMVAYLSTIEAQASELKTAEKAASDVVSKWCSDLNEGVKKLSWKVDPCQGIDWKLGGTSVQGRPLVYAEFGDPNATNTTLIFTMVHSDEVTPLFLGIQLVYWMKEHQASLPGTRVIIAPLVNPDGFFKTPRTRMNSRGVDVNRNFSTRDWDTKALKAWKNQYKSNPRRYPGPHSDSEPETVFQRDLIKKLNPQKILSVHAPLNFLDYDGPNFLALAKFPREYVKECLKLRAQLKAISGGFFPGSLGNYAGNELGIPTITLELPTADPKKAEGYWEKFKPGIRTMIEFKVPNYAKSDSPRNGG